MGEDVVEELAHLFDHLVRGRKSSCGSTAAWTSSDSRLYIWIVQGTRAQAPMFVF